MAATGSEPLQPDTKCSFSPVVSRLKETMKSEGGGKKSLGSNLCSAGTDLYSDGILFISCSGGGQRGRRQGWVGGSKNGSTVRFRAEIKLACMLQKHPCSQIAEMKALITFTGGGTVTGGT